MLGALIPFNIRCRKCKKGAKFWFDLNTYGWIELVELIKNIRFKIIFDQSLAEKFSKYRAHSKKWKKKFFFLNPDFVYLCVFYHFEKNLFGFSVKKWAYPYSFECILSYFFFTVRSTRLSKKHNRLLFSQTHQLLCLKPFAQPLYTIRIVN